MPPESGTHVIAAHFGLNAFETTALVHLAVAGPLVAAQIADRMDLLHVPEQPSSICSTPQHGRP